MDLKEYLYQKRLSVHEFSKLIDYDRSHVGQVMNGKRKAGRKMIDRIEKITEGLVKKDDLLKLYKEFNKII